MRSYCFSISHSQSTLHNKQCHPRQDYSEVSPILLNVLRVGLIGGSGSQLSNCTTFLKVVYRIASLGSGPTGTFCCWTYCRFPAS